MARMVPFPMLPTESSAERRLYEGFLSQLANEYVVYHSVDWVLAPTEPGGPPVQGECDFLVAHPVDGLLVLEAKGGELSYDPQIRRWFQAGRGGRHPLDEDPFHQARDEVKSLEEILTHQPGWQLWRPSLGYGVAFPDTRYDTDARPDARAALAIDRDDMEHLDRRVKEIMRAWRRPERRFGARGMEALEQALGMRIEIRMPLNLRFDEEDRKIVELTNDQAYVLSYVTKRHRVAIVGPAGSGKTLLAAQVAKRRASGGTRTLLTCVNRQLASHLQGLASGTPNLDVFQFKALCEHLAEEAGIRVPKPHKETDASSAHFEETTLPELLGRAAEALGPRYAAMVVDEAQDFRPPWWASLLRLHTAPERGGLYLFADSNRSLYAGSVPEELVDLTLPLSANLRNTKPIHEFVSVFYEGDGVPLGRGPAGRPVEVLSYRDEEGLARLLARVLENLRAEEVPLRDVVVLTPTGPAKSALLRRGRVDGYRLSEDPGPGAVLACSVHAFKGLERPVVILAELGDRHEEHLDQYLYVGGSRAQNHLIVLATEPVAKRLRALASVAHP